MSAGKKYPAFFDCFVSGAKEIRTPDLCIANAALSQLSYRPRSAFDSSACRLGCLQAEPASKSFASARCLFRLRKKWPQLVDKVARVGKLPIDAGEADKGYFVEILEMLHHQFA